MLLALFFGKIIKGTVLRIAELFTGAKRQTGLAGRLRLELNSYLSLRHVKYTDAKSVCKRVADMPENSSALWLRYPLAVCLLFDHEGYYRACAILLF